jgi:glycerol transport system ATP-binding protein
VLDGGRVAAMGPTAEVFARPATLAVARAIAEPALNEIRLAARDGAFRLADGSRFEAPGGLALPGEGACTLGFGPEHIAMARADDDAVRFVVRMSGEEMIGGRAYLRLGFAGETWLAPKPETGAPATGVTLSVFVDRARLMAFDADGARIS